MVITLAPSFFFFHLCNQERSSIHPNAAPFLFNRRD
jgi:hypothetical protein